MRKSLDQATQNRSNNPLVRAYRGLFTALHTLNFFYRDVKPAIRARQQKPREDVITQLVQDGYSERSILIECMTYGTAGMVTTREFIVMVAWHFFDNPELKDRFLADDEAGQLAIIEEILRLEPVATFLMRRAVGEATGPGGTPIEQGKVYSIDIRSTNVDEAFTGECPFALDPERAKRMKVVGSYMSFGDGPHRCPGAQVALQETRIFVDRLFRLPGLRLAKPPTMTWLDALGSYELRDAIVECERG
jgi:cytochrome P450